MGDKESTPWRQIDTFAGEDREKVDIWLHIYASPRSMGWHDGFRVIDAWRVDGKWFHYHEGREEELFLDYITHWMPIPAPPPERAGED